MIEFNGVWTATVMLPMLGGGTIEQAAICIHEMFHVYQKRNHESWFGNEAELFMYPVAESHLLAMKRMEIEMLVRAVSALDEAGLVGWAEAAMELRRARFKLMSEGAVEYDRHTEGTEGLAHYIQVKASGSLEGAMRRPAGGFAPDRVRQSGYFSGIQIGLALDRLMPDWRERREQQDTLNLDDLLNEALAKRSKPLLSLPSDERLIYEEKAAADTKTLQGQRERVLEDLLNAPGWSVEVLAPAVAPLFPQGFDPMNLCVVDMKHVIHQRWAKVGNAAGQLEILDRAMLTEGQGNHPMFEGMLRALVTGLEKEPALSVEDGAVEISVQDLTVSFTGAELKRQGRRITIILPVGSAQSK